MTRRGRIICVVAITQTWFKQAIGDEELVDIANRAQSEPNESRQRLLAAIRERYTNPA